TNGSGRYREALGLAEQLLRVAGPDGDSALLLEAHHSLWTTMTAMGETAAAIPHCERGIALYDPACHAPSALAYASHDAGACCRFQLAQGRWLLGYPERAATAIQEALGLAENLAHAPTTIITLGTAAFLKYQMGDRESARETAERL